MVILGVDPAISVSGYALIEVVNNSYKSLDFGCIKTNSKAQFASRLKQIYDDLSQIIVKNKPDIFAIEEVFYMQNFQIAIKMGHARGVSLLAAVNHSLSIYEYSPREIKLAVTGNGGASKQQVQKMIVHLLQLQQPPTPYDITDAMAVAICHFNRRKNLT